LEPFIASTTASLVGIAGFIAIADLMAHYTKLFRKSGVIETNSRYYG
jgi:hypothetical protein